MTLILFYASVAAAHEIRPAVVDMNLGPQGYTAEILLNLESLMAGIEPQHSDTSESLNAPLYDELRGLSAAQLEARFLQFEATFLGSIRIEDNQGASVQHEVVAVAIDETGDTDLARDSRITLRPLFMGDTTGVSWAWEMGNGSSIVRVNKADGEADDDAYSAFLQDGERSDLIPLSGDIELGFLDLIWNYLVVGFTHILPKGLDHILFVAGLFLLSPALRPLLIQVTSFTVAHTVTLALGALGMLTISPAIVEPLIAASIVYVAVENIFSSKLHAWRPVIVFCFGLLHGLGFAGVLADVGIASNFFVTALISFNVGVELGQLAVIAICLMLFGWFRKSPNYRRFITVPLSLVIAAIGAFWFVERVAG